MKTLEQQHNVPKPSPVVILCNEQQAKKYKKQLAEFYGLKEVRMDWQGTFDLSTYSSLHLTYREDVYKAVKHIGVVKAVTIEQAVMEFNSAIEYTPWRQGKPRFKGEYHAFTGSRPPEAFNNIHHVRHWWNGQWWSRAYSATAYEYVRNCSANMRSPVLELGNTWWRGLSKKPIILDC
jgi:hypothetical protein